MFCDRRWRTADVRTFRRGRDVGAQPVLCNLRWPSHRETLRSCQLRWLQGLLPQICPQEPPIHLQVQLLLVKLFPNKICVFPVNSVKTSIIHSFDFLDKISQIIKWSKFTENKLITPDPISKLHFSPKCNRYIKVYKNTRLGTNDLNQYKSKTL